MDKIKFKIDEKSLFYGIKNDFKKGQSSTVHTPINQSKNPKKWHLDILQLLDYDIDTKNIPQTLLEKCLPHTTSQAKSKINALYVFNDISFDGKNLECDASFCMYIKEEIDKNIKKRDGTISENTHYGRKKLHYTKTLKYIKDGFNIDNKKVLDSILDQNGGFAYVVRGFEYNIINKSLNFITSMIGPKDILLSNVFKRAKGTGKKLLLNDLNSEDYEIVNEILFSKKEPTNLNDIQSVFELANKTKVENGKLGEAIVMEKLQELTNITDLYQISLDYPTSPYDIEYYENGVKKYIEVKATQGDKKIFNLSMGESKFMTQYKNDYTLFLITHVKDKFPKISTYTYDKIIKLKHEYPSTRYFD